MSKKKASADLREFFAEELRGDPNATLETALWHLRDFYERGPENPAAGELSTRLAETQALVEMYEEHTPLAEFV
jgi:hypothetical protein